MLRFSQRLLHCCSTFFGYFDIFLSFTLYNCMICLVFVLICYLFCIAGLINFLNLLFSLIKLFFEKLLWIFRLGFNFWLLLMLNCTCFFFLYVLLILFKLNYTCFFFLCVLLILFLFNKIDLIQFARMIFK